jgi:hypothetical protein
MKSPDCPFNGSNFEARGNGAPRRTRWRTARLRTLQRRELGHSSVHPEKDRADEDACDGLADQPEAEKYNAQPNKNRQADQCDRRRDPKGVDPLANASAMIEPVGQGRAGRPQGGNQELHQKNFHYVISMASTTKKEWEIGRRSKLARIRCKSVEMEDDIVGTRRGNKNMSE